MLSAADRSDILGNRGESVRFPAKRVSVFPLVLLVSCCQERIEIADAPKARSLAETHSGKSRPLALTFPQFADTKHDHPLAPWLLQSSRLQN